MVAGQCPKFFCMIFVMKRIALEKRSSIRYIDNKRPSFTQNFILGPILVHYKLYLKKNCLHQTH